MTGTAARSDDGVDRSRDLIAARRRDKLIPVYTFNPRRCPRMRGRWRGRIEDGGIIRPRVASNIIRRARARARGTPPLRRHWAIHFRRGTPDDYRSQRRHLTFRRSFVRAKLDLSALNSFAGFEFFMFMYTHGQTVRGLLLRERISARTATISNIISLRGERGERERERERERGISFSALITSGHLMN